MMVSFNNKKINAIKTLGEKLQEHRLNYGLSLESISKETAINLKYLIALESDNYEKLPADIYTCNFLKKYAVFLDLNPETAIETYVQEKILYYKTKKQCKEIRDKKIGKVRKVVNFFLSPVFLKYSFSVVVVAALLIYIGWSVNRIFTPPHLVIMEPQDSLITVSRQLWIKGESEKEAFLTMNGQEIISDHDGRFSNKVDLQKGLNVIKITARKKHSKENVQYLQIILEETGSVSQK
ncbi:MAG TPA: helix-turn-helix domain-containing protein [Candidatus Bipolaricaulota bacterium]|nr:helix-turn-helix domain-containing protein [Candidatus Bipolaricaulota bacterium]